MTPLTWLAIGIGVPVAYAAMAGVTLRFLGGRVDWRRALVQGDEWPPFCIPLLGQFAAFAAAIVAALSARPGNFPVASAVALWPVFWAMRFVAVVLGGPARALRATFRLTSGQTMNKHDNPTHGSR